VLRHDPAWIPDLSVVAVLGGDLVGHASMTRMAVSGSPALALAPVSVSPAAQGHGAGRAMVDELISRAEEHGEALVVVLGDPAYYDRFGFRPALALGVTGPFEDAGDAFQALRLTDRAPEGYATYAAPFGIPG